MGVFGFSLSYSKRFLEWLRFQSIGTRDYIYDKFKLMFLDYTPNQILLAMTISSTFAGGVVFLATLPNLFPGIPLAFLTAFVVWKAPKPIVDYLYKRRVDKFVLQMVDGLGLMSNGMKSGLSIVQALGLAAEEMPNPLKQEFELVLSENKLGVSLEEAFTNLSNRVVADDVEMFVTAINILKETGGNLAETFDTIVMTIRERIKVQQKISALTAQGMYQGAFVLSVPPLMGVVFYQSDPNFMRPLFTTLIGWIILTVIAALEVLGAFVIMKIVKIDV